MSELKTSILFISAQAREAAELMNQEPEQEQAPISIWLPDVNALSPSGEKSCIVFIGGMELMVTMSYNKLHPEWIKAKQR